uniref:Uncharacterized protein n=1 Tax=Triticum urartu TaxID=4572 RepID=A0A8R7P9U3_TRIUA
MASPSSPPLQTLDPPVPPCPAAVQFQPLPRRAAHGGVGSGVGVEARCPCVWRGTRTWSKTRTTACSPPSSSGSPARRHGGCSFPCCLSHVDAAPIRARAIEACR